MPEHGDSKPVPPSPDEYERLRRAAELLRESADKTGDRPATRHTQDLRKYMRYTGLGVQFLAMLGLPMAAGWWLDGMTGSRPWLMAGGSVVGMIAAMVFVVRSVLRMESESRP
jgi:F0F1-type ATP synthase assembly protein I